MKPTFVGIGGHKCGSTWLSECMREHPEVFVSDPKEIGYYTAYNHRGIDWYMKHFKESVGYKAVGEFSSTYLYGDAIADMIYNDLGKVKIVCAVRPPRERFISHLKQLIRKGLVEEEDLPKNDEALEGSNFMTNNPRLLNYGLYFKCLGEFLRVFGRENVLILNQNDFLTHPDLIIKKLYGFLSVDTDFQPSILNKKVSKGIIPRFSILEKMRIRIYDYLFHNYPSAITFIKRNGISELYRKFNGKRDSFYLGRKSKDDLDAFYYEDWTLTKTLIY